MKKILEELLHEFQLPLENPVLIFSLILLIILLAPLVLNRFKIPGIIGLIISGIAIGPHGLNLLEESLFVDVFSTIGLLYIMFIAGLELDLNEFRSNKNRSLLFGMFTFTIPLIIGLPVCYYLLEYDFNASFLTASMFATHTLLTYPIVSRLNVSKNEAVAITVGGTILTDTAVLLILAVILGSHQGGLSVEFWIRMSVALVIFSMIMFLVVPRIAKWFFRTLESEKYSHYIFVLAIVFFAAFLAEISGFEPIIGAFMAGLALNKLIPHSSALMNRIEFIGSSLFIPFFLISVGMLVDLSVVLKGPRALIVAGTLSVVAIAGKWMAAWISKLLFKYTKAQGQLIFGLSSAHAAATLAVILVGYREGILDENILNGTILLILITSIVASFATEKAAKKIVVSNQASSGIVEKELNEERILLPLANIANMDKALDFSVLIKDKNSKAPISVLSVVPNDEEAEKNIAVTKSQYEKLISDASASENNVEILSTIDHNVSSGIARTSREIMASLILLGWPKKRGFVDKLIGEKLDDLLSYTTKTVFVCDFEQPLIDHKRIIITIPKLAELEAGFPIWLAKIVRLAQELTIPIQIHCHPETKNDINKVLKNLGEKQRVKYESLEDWEDFLILSRDVNEMDIFIVVSARKGNVSYQNLMDNLPAKMDKHFARNSKIIIYP